MAAAPMLGVMVLRSAGAARKGWLSSCSALARRAGSNARESSRKFRNSGERRDHVFTSGRPREAIRYIARIGVSFM